MWLDRQTDFVENFLSAICSSLLRRNSKMPLSATFRRHSCGTFRGTILKKEDADAGRTALRQLSEESYDGALRVKDETKLSPYQLGGHCSHLLCAEVHFLRLDQQNSRCFACMNSGHNCTGSI